MDVGDCSRSYKAKYACIIIMDSKISILSQLSLFLPIYLVVRNISSSSSAISLG